jgi:hypothetical protein
MIDYFATLILQTLAVIDSFSVALILGSVTILTILEITRVPHQEMDRTTKISRSVLGAGIVTQIVYRGVDILATYNLIANDEIIVGDISAVYSLTLILTIAGFLTYVFQKRRNITFQMFVFLEAAIWYTMFALKEVTLQSVTLMEMSSGALSLLTMIIVILLLLIADSSKRYYHKKNKK